MLQDVPGFDKAQFGRYVLIGIEANLRIILFKKGAILKNFILSCGILVLVFSLNTQSSLAYNKIEEGCTVCHLKIELHEIASHTACTNCHENPAGAKDVAPAKCVVCHAGANSDPCVLVRQHVRIMKNCASCHSQTFSADKTGIATAGPSCTSCHTDCASACPAAKVLGEDDPRLNTLRLFRDNVMAGNRVGKMLIALYYNNAEQINDALEKYPGLKRFSSKVLQVFISITEK